MKYTENLKLKKQELSDVIDIEGLNDNFDIIDQKIIQNSLGLNDMAKKTELTNHISASASTATKGHVQLNNTVTSTSIVLGATANSVKTAYDKGKEALDKANNNARLLNRLSGETVLAFLMWMEEITLTVPTGDITGRSNFRVAICGTDETNKHLGVIVSGKTGLGNYLHVIGSTMISPSSTVTERYTGCGVWSAKGTDESNRLINQYSPIVGTSYVDGISNRGFGVYLNEFTSCLVAGKSTDIQLVELLGIYLHNDSLRFTFKKRSSMVKDPTISPKISWEVW